MSSNQEYTVALDVFEGPLDLLLYLIKKSEVDIYDIPIETITRQYMEYLKLMRMLDLNIAGEFLVMAATLMMIKSRMLLPVEDRADVEDDDDGADPRWDLIRQLVEYKKFKDAAMFLEGLEERQGNVFLREGDHVELGPEPELALGDVGIFDLISAFQEALNKAPQETMTEIMADRFTVEEMVDRLITRMTRQERVSLRAVFSEMRSRAEIVTAFLAILELMKMKQLCALQDGMFGEIVLERHEEWGAPATIEQGDE